MAKHVEVVLTCDVTRLETGEEVSDGVVTRQIGIDTSGWREVDLTKELSDELDEFLSRFLRVSRPGSPPAARRPAGKNSDRNAEIRAWARNTPWGEGLTERGRIPADVLARFYAEHPDLDRPPAHQVKLHVVPDPPADEPPPTPAAARRQPVPPVAKFQEASAVAPAANVAAGVRVAAGAPAGGHADRMATAHAIRRWAKSDQAPPFTAEELRPFFAPKSVTNALRTWMKEHPRYAKQWGFYIEPDGKDGKLRLTAAAAESA